MTSKYPSPNTHRQSVSCPWIPNFYSIVKYLKLNHSSWNPNIPLSHNLFYLWFTSSQEIAASCFQYLGPKPHGHVLILFTPIKPKYNQQILPSLSKYNQNLSTFHHLYYHSVPSQHPFLTKCFSLFHPWPSRATFSSKNIMLAINVIHILETTFKK